MARSCGLWQSSHKRVATFAVVASPIVCRLKTHGPAVPPALRFFITDVLTAEGVVAVCVGLPIPEPSERVLRSGKPAPPRQDSLLAALILSPLAPDPARGR